MALIKDIREVDVGHYYPLTTGPAKEFQTIREIENPEYKRLWGQAWKLFFNTFVYDFDVDGAARWEEMLHIVPEPDASLLTRRMNILAKLNRTLPYTERKLQSMLDGTYGAGNVKEIVEYDKYAVWFEVVAGYMVKVREILRFARPIIPANMGIYIRNTKYAKLKIYFAGHVHTHKVIFIAPSANFSAAGLTGGRAVAGYIKFRKIYRLRMEA